MINSRASRVTRFASIVLLAFSLLSMSNAEENQTRESISFESEGMSLYLEELLQTEAVIWAIDFIDSDTMIFTERKGQINLLDLDTNEVSVVTGGPVVFF